MLPLGGRGRAGQGCGVLRVVIDLLYDGLAQREAGRGLVQGAAGSRAIQTPLSVFYTENH